MDNTDLLIKWLEWYRVDAEARGDKFSQTALCEKAGLPSSYISRIVTRKTKLGDVVLTKLTDALGISKAEFFAGPPPNAASSGRMMFVDGITVRTRREKAGMGVSALAGKVGCDPWIIASIETVLDNEIDAGFAARLARALGTTTNDLERRRQDVHIDGFKRDVRIKCSVCEHYNINNVTGCCYQCGQPLKSAGMHAVYYPASIADPQVRVEKAFTLPDGAEFDTEDMLRMKAVKLLCEMKGGDLERVVAYIEGIHAARDAEKKRSTA